MNEQRVLARTLAIVKRQWWIVAVVVVVALAVGWFTVAESDDIYTSSTIVSVDTAPSSRFRGMPVPDDLVRDVTGRLREGISEASGVDASVLKSGLRATTSGDPQTRIIISLSASTKAASEAGAIAAAEAVIDVVQSAAAPEVEWRKAQITASEEALAALETTDGGATPWEESDTLFKRWTIETQLGDYRTALRSIEGVYSFDGEVSTSMVSGASVKRRNLVGVALVGLVLGLVLAAGREYLSWRAGRD